MSAAAAAGLAPEARERLLVRIGLGAVPAADVAGLRDVHRAFVSRVPFENLAVQLGESAPLDPEALVARMLAGGRGGYCFEVNTVLALLLSSLGFSVERREGIVGVRDARAAGEPMNHLALVVGTPAGETFLADAGLGEGPLEPLPLAEGATAIGAFAFRVEREATGWWVGFPEHASGDGWRFEDAAVPLAAFEPHHRRLSCAPDSGFVRTLVVQQPRVDGTATLRARTLSFTGPGRRERAVLAHRDAFAAALADEFGIDPAALGDERLDRLWTQACAQHAAYVGGAA